VALSLCKHFACSSPAAAHPHVPCRVIVPPPTLDCSPCRRSLLLRVGLGVQCGFMLVVQGKLHPFGGQRNGYGGPLREGNPILATTLTADWL
jgi:hypothetical protein